jgi:hypothetical protein
MNISAQETACLFAFGWFYAERSVRKRARAYESVLELKSFGHAKGKLDLRTPYGQVSVPSSSGLPEFSDGNLFRRLFR